MDLSVHFYILNTSSFQDCLQTVSHLAEKAYQSQRNIFIYTENATTTTLVDETLWTFRDNAFLPHTTTNHPIENCPIEIGDQSPSFQKNDVLINLTANVPPFFTQFKTIIELIYQNDTHKIAGRERFRFYKEKHCKLETHSL